MWHRFCLELFWKKMRHVYLSRKQAMTVMQCLTTHFLENWSLFSTRLYSTSACTISRHETGNHDQSAMFDGRKASISVTARCGKRHQQQFEVFTCWWLMAAQMSSCIVYIFIKYAYIQHIHRYLTSLNPTKPFFVNHWPLRHLNVQTFPSETIPIAMLVGGFSASHFAKKNIQTLQVLWQKKRLETTTYKLDRKDPVIKWGEITPFRTYLFTHL